MKLFPFRFIFAINSTFSLFESYCFLSFKKISNRTTSIIASKLCQLVSKPFSMPSKAFLITNHPSCTNASSTSMNFTDSTNYYKKNKKEPANLKPPSQHPHMATASAFRLLFLIISTPSWMLTHRQPNLSSQKTPIRQGSHQKKPK